MLSVEEIRHEERFRQAGGTSGTMGDSNPRPRIVVRFEGPGSKRMPQPTEEELNQGWTVLTVQFVPSKEGHPTTAVENEQMQMSAGVLR